MEIHVSKNMCFLIAKLNKLSNSKMLNMNENVKIVHFNPVKRRKTIKIPSTERLANL